MSLTTFGEVPRPVSGSHICEDLRVVRLIPRRAGSISSLCRSRTDLKAKKTLFAARKKKVPHNKRSAVRFWTQKIQVNATCCFFCVSRREGTRRVHIARRWTQASKPALTDPSLAAKRGAEALHVVFFSTKHTSPAR